MGSSAVLLTCVDMVPLRLIRLFRRSSLGILHYTLLLVLFGAAAAKAQHTPLLAAMLLSELPSLFFLAGKLQVPAGSSLICSSHACLPPAHSPVLMVHQLRGPCHLPPNALSALQPWDAGMLGACLSICLSGCNLPRSWRACLAAPEQGSWRAGGS